MFSKEKLEQQIDALDHEIIDLEHRLILLVKNSTVYKILKERRNNLKDLKQTLKQIHTTITSDNM